MIRRTATMAVTTALLVALVAAPAFGWGNGGNEGNGYSTHDWLLEHAIRMAGRDASWIDINTALRATDDPDYAPTATPGTMHAYKNSGVHQGGPQAVADEYYRIVIAYNDGDYAEASRLLGVMSHYYSDICEPYHTDNRGSASVNPRHFPYEADVAEKTAGYDDMPDWLSRMASQDITDVRRSAVEAALYARSTYANVDASYAAHGLDDGHYAYDATGWVLNRSVNDLADIIAAIPAGEGMAKPPAVMKHKMQKMTYYYPRKGDATGDMIRTEVSCHDEAGKPMRGVPITFTWPFADGARSYIAYTDANGLAYNWQAPGVGIPLMKKRTLSAWTAVSGEVATSTTWYMPTPELAHSTSGMRTSVSNTRPKRGTTVRAWTRIRDTAGRPVVGLPVTYSWHFKSRIIKVTAVTNSNGYVYSSQKLGNVAKGYRVYVRSRTYAGRHTRNSYASFVPR